MKFFFQSAVLLLVFAMLALGTQVTFCGAAQSVGWDVHGHEVCAAEHSHDQDGEFPCQNDCEPELKEAQITKCDPVPSPTVSEAVFRSVLVRAPMCRTTKVLSFIHNSEPPDGLPDRFSPSFTGCFLV